MTHTPLIDLAAGRDQDDRSSLLAAFGRCISAQTRREVTDLHVRELLTYVLAVQARSGAGVKMTYDELGTVLCCERSTARKIVSRAHQMGLLAIHQEQYSRGGQSANRYSIDWANVRSCNANPSAYLLTADAESPTAMSEADRRPGGATPPNDHLDSHSAATPAEPSRICFQPVRQSVPQHDRPAAYPTGTADKGIPGDTMYHPGATTYHAPATTGHPPATMYHPGATTAHPYKEQYPNSSPPLSRNSAAARAAADSEKESRETQGPTITEDDIDRARVVELCIKLKRHQPALDSDFIWQTMVVAEWLDIGFGDDLVARIRSGKIAKSRSYLDAALRKECEQRRLVWRELKERIPPRQLQPAGQLQ